MKRYNGYSLWLDTAGESLAQRTPLPGDADYDVAVVGGGYTGLWTAYYLAKADPSLRVVVLEKEICGFGASGRNGGWCSALFAASRAKIASAHGAGAAVAMQRAMFATVDEVGRVLEEEGIDADFAKGGALTFATSTAHLDRVKSNVEDEARWGFGEDVMWLARGEAAERVRVQGSLGAVYTPHCAALHPALLARGLARAAESAGVTIHEGTAVRAMAPGRAETERGTVKAEVIVRALEGYTPALEGHRRLIAPLYSLMIATEPLPPDVWSEIGWRERETLTDGRHLIIYAQRTADGRIAFGGRGAPYHFGSRVRDGYDLEPSVFLELHRVMRKLFPAAGDARITHRWGGPLGVPRDWFSSVGLDRHSGVAWGGGYVGDGVSTANLAGRTIADLVLERATDVTRLPWVGHHWRRWEPEPLRWLGINLALKTMELADRAEARTGKPSRRGELIRRLVGAS